MYIHILFFLVLILVYYKKKIWNLFKQLLLSQGFRANMGKCFDYTINMSCRGSKRLLIWC